MRFRLRTLLIVLAILPPLLAWAWWSWWEWQHLRAAELERQQMFEFCIGLMR